MRNTASQAVKAVGKSPQIVGNITPPIWYRKIKTSKGRTDHIAVAVLADVWSWHRPEYIQDQETNKVVAIKNRFKGEMFHCSYQRIADNFDCSHENAKDAVNLLAHMGLIKKIWWNGLLPSKDNPKKKVHYSNVLHLEPIAEEVVRFTEETDYLPKRVDDIDSNVVGISDKKLHIQNTPSPNSWGGQNQEGVGDGNDTGGHSGNGVGDGGENTPDVHLNTNPLNKLCVPQSDGQQEPDDFGIGFQKPKPVERVPASQALDHLKETIGKSVLPTKQPQPTPPSYKPQNGVSAWKHFESLWRNIVGSEYAAVPQNLKERIEGCASKDTEYEYFAKARESFEQAIVADRIDCIPILFVGEWEKTIGNATVRARIQSRQSSYTPQYVDTSPFIVQPAE